MYGTKITKTIYQNLRQKKKKTKVRIKKAFFELKMAKATPVFVFQMGKVASSSIHESLIQQYKGAVGHDHSIESTDYRTRSIYTWHLQGKPLKIISPVREPISRNISAFFHLFRNYTGEEVDRNQYSVNELESMFLNPRAHDLQVMKHDQAFTWFNKNIEKYFGIDVYGYPFPERGYEFYRNKNVELLVFRIELPDETKEQLISKFLGIEGFSLMNANVGHKKNYATIYREFKRKVRLPEAYVTEMCDSKYFNHFYRREDILKTRNKWMK